MGKIDAPLAHSTESAGRWSHRLGVGVRRAAAILGLLAILALIFHGGTMAYSLWTGWYVYDIAKGSALLIAACVVLHVICVLVLFFFFSEGTDFVYTKANRATLLQRISAIAILVLLHFHMTAYTSVALGQTIDLGQCIFYCVTEALFFGFVLTHVAISTSRGLATMGWVRNFKVDRLINRVCYVTCAIAMVIITIGMIIFYVHGMA